MVFEGIPRDAVRFYGELEQDNSKEFWDRQQQRYAVSVREPLTLLVEALAGEFGEPHVYRPQRDLRFSHDKRPYKDHQGAVVRVADGMGWYVEVGAGGLATAGGAFRPAPDQVERGSGVPALTVDAMAEAIAAVVRTALSYSSELTRPSNPARPSELTPPADVALAAGSLH